MHFHSFFQYKDFMAEKRQSFSSYYPVSSLEEYNSSIQLYDSWKIESFTLLTVLLFSLQKYNFLHLKL